MKKGKKSQIGCSLPELSTTHVRTIFAPLSYHSRTTLVPLSYHSRTMCVPTLRGKTLQNCGIPTRNHESMFLGTRSPASRTSQHGEPRESSHAQFNRGETRKVELVSFPCLLPCARQAWRPFGTTLSSIPWWAKDSLRSWSPRTAAVAAGRGCTRRTSRS